MGGEKASKYTRKDGRKEVTSDPVLLSIVLVVVIIQTLENDTAPTDLYSSDLSTPG